VRHQGVAVIVPTYCEFWQSIEVLEEAKVLVPLYIFFQFEEGIVIFGPFLIEGQDFLLQLLFNSFVFLAVVFFLERESEILHLPIFLADSIALHYIIDFTGGSA